MGVDDDARDRTQHRLLVKPGKERERCAFQRVADGLSIMKRPFVPRARTGNLEALELSQDSITAPEVQQALMKLQKRGTSANYLFVPAEYKILIGFPGGKHDKVRRESQLPEHLDFCGGELCYWHEAG